MSIIRLLAWTILPIAFVVCGCATKPDAPKRAVAIAALPPAAPPTSAPIRPPFVWLEFPPASAMEIVAIVELTSKDVGAAADGIAQMARAWRADGALQVPEVDLLRPQTNFSFFAPNLRSPKPDELAHRTRLIIFRFTGPSPFLSGYYHPDSGQFLSGSEPSIFRSDPALSYTNFGRYVRSPYAPAQPPVNIIGLPDGATVVCPYSHKPFVLW